MTKRTFCCRLKWIIYALTTIGVIYLFLIYGYTNTTVKRSQYVETDNFYYQENAVQITRKISMNQQACVHPSLNINDPDIMQHYHSVPVVQCNADPDWITIKGNTISVSDYSKQKYGNIKCKIKYILRQDDFSNSFSEVFHLNSSMGLQLKHDFFTCVCETIDKKHQYENIHAGITFKQDAHERLFNATSGLGLDVLMLGFDSLSHMAYMRKLKKTYEYFTNTLNGTVLNGYNIVGDGTPQALIPIFTGKTELELPRTLKRLSVKRYVDVFPLIWKDFKANGYVTAFAEDCSHIGTFTYRMNGFNHQPTDYYMRPFHIVARDNYFSKFRNLCLGSKRRSEIFFNWVKDFYVMYKQKRKFMFGFHSEISHEDNNYVETGDDDLQLTLKYLNEGGYLNNTLLILMSDHGARFSKVRSSLQGKQEERRPFFGFAFPKWFERKYPNIVKNLKINVNRLSSPFDLYPTFRDILNYSETENVDVKKQRGISLFKEIPKSRTCDDADIDSHWCACLDWLPVDKDGDKVKQAVQSLLDHINNLTHSQRSLCSELKVKTVVEALCLLPQKDLLKFKMTNDADGFRADLSDNTRLKQLKYQVRIYTTPGNGFFEATLSYKTAGNLFSVKTEDISRINKYGKDPQCIEKSHEELRKYCYCKSNLHKI